MSKPLFSLQSINLDGNTFHGLLAHHAAERGLAIHVHGTGGDFFTNGFIVPAGEEYLDAGLSYLTANFPGYLSAAANEHFVDSFPALDRWIELIRPAGPVVLQGHSLGALKALEYVRNWKSESSTKVKGLVLLSPFDIVAFYLNGFPDKREETDRYLETVISAGQGGNAVPSSMFAHWPISAQTMKEMTQIGGPADRFPSRSESLATFLTGIHLPVLAILGGDDFAQFPNPKKVFSSLPQSPQLSTHFIERAPHNFSGYEKDVAQAIGSWIATQELM